MLTFTNDRTGETITFNGTHEELVQRFADRHRLENHWLWFHMAKSVDTGMSNALSFISDSFLFAIGMGATVRAMAPVKYDRRGVEKKTTPKQPMIRLHWRDYRYKITTVRPKYNLQAYQPWEGNIYIHCGRLSPGTHDPVGDEFYLGSLTGGKFNVGSNGWGTMRQKIQLDDAQQDFVERLGSQPVTLFAQASKDMGRCCYCNQPLSTPESKDAGYGPICATTWGLSWGTTYQEKVPSFADLWLNGAGPELKNVKDMMTAIRQDPYDQLSWQVLGDALEEAGWQGRLKPSVPERTLLIPKV